MWSVDANEGSDKKAKPKRKITLFTMLKLQKKFFTTKFLLISNFVLIHAKLTTWNDLLNRKIK